MSQRIVAVTGISGVGKTTVLRRLAQLIDFQHVTGGSLIAAAREIAVDSRDIIRYADLDENQRLLVEGFALTRDPYASLVIIDGHVVIDGAEGLSKIPSNVFKALGVSIMVHLEAPPEQIAINRAGDASRPRPFYSRDLLEQHQMLSRWHAHAVSGILNIPLHIVTHDDANQLVNLLEIR